MRTFNIFVIFKFMFVSGSICDYQGKNPWTLQATLVFRRLSKGSLVTPLKCFSTKNSWPNSSFATFLWPWVWIFETSSRWWQHRKRNSQYNRNGARLSYKSSWPSWNGHTTSETSHSRSATNTLIDYIPESEFPKKELNYQLEAVLLVYCNLYNLNRITWVRINRTFLKRWHSFFYGMAE